MPNINQPIALTGRQPLLGSVALSAEPIVTKVQVYKNVAKKSVADHTLEQLKTPEGKAKCGSTGDRGRRPT